MGVRRVIILIVQCGRVLVMLGKPERGGVVGFG